MFQLIEKFYLLFQGALIFQGIFFFGIYIIARRQDALWYSLYLLAAAVYFFINASGTFFNIDENAVFESGWYNAVNIPVLIIENLFYLLFIRHFFFDLIESKKVKKIVNLVLLTIPFLFVVFLILKLAGISTQVIFYTVKMLSVFPALFIVVTLARNRLPYASLVIYGLMCTIAGTSLTVLMIVLGNNGVHYLLTDSYPLIFIRLGILGDMIFYQLALLKKWKAQERLLAMQQLESELAIKKVRNNISKELHDDIGSTLSGIQLYSHMAMSQAASGNMKETNNTLQVIQHSATEMVGRLKDIVWLLQSTGDNITELAEKLQEYAAYMCHAKKIQLNTTVHEVLENKKISKEKSHQLFMIGKEAINNAVKYSNASIIAIDMAQEENMLVFSVSDNGAGFNVKDVYSGNGLLNMQRRAAEVQGAVVINSSPEKGTVLQLTIHNPS